MKFLVFLFFLVIFYILKAVASIGQGTVEIARSAYETVYKKPEKERDKYKLLYIDWEALLLIIEEVIKEKVEHDSETSYMKKIIKTNGDKKLLISFLTIERFFFSMFCAEATMGYVRKKEDIICAALGSLACVYEKLYNISKSDLFEIYYDIYYSNRKKYYQEYFKPYKESLRKASKFDKNLLSCEMMMLGNKISADFAFESYKSYKKDYKINKYIKCSESSHEFLLNADKIKFLTTRDFLVFLRLEEHSKLL